MHTWPYLVLRLSQLLLELLHPQPQLLDLSLVALHPSVGVGELHRLLLELLLQLSVNMAKVRELLRTQHTQTAGAVSETHSRRAELFFGPPAHVLLRNIGYRLSERDSYQDN